MLSKTLNKQHKQQMDNQILVIYVGVAGIRSEDIESFVHKVANKITPQSFEGEIIILPAQSPETRIECINPKYITNAELIKAHTDMMQKLQEALQNQIVQIKQEKNEPKN